MSSEITGFLIGATSGLGLVLIIAAVLYINFKKKKTISMTEWFLNEQKEKLKTLESGYEGMRRNFYNKAVSAEAQKRGTEYLEPERKKLKDIEDKVQRQKDNVEYLERWPPIYKDADEIRGILAGARKYRETKGKKSKS